MEKNYKTKKEEMKNEKTAGNAIVFENPEFGKIRTLTDEDGEPLFCAKDVCDVLGYKKSYDAVKQLVNRLDTAKRGSKVPGSLRKDGTSSERFQQMLFVNESGFYALVLGSKLPTAVKFKNWVTSEVLPQIRKTGADYAHMGLAKSRTRYSTLPDPHCDGVQEKLGTAYTHTYLVWTERGRKFIHLKVKR